MTTSLLLSGCFGGSSPKSPVSVSVTPSSAQVYVSLTAKFTASVTGYATIGGIQQPIISQRKLEHEIRLKEGEVSILGGLFERVDTKTLNGWPGLANVPVMRYLFASDDSEKQENENLIVLIPRIVRMPDWSLENLRAMYAGSETYPSAKKVVDLQSPSANPDPALPSSLEGSSASLRAPRTPQLQANGPRVRFEPPSTNLHLGETVTIGLVVENMTDLSAVPLLLEYDPAVVSVEKVDQGDFLSGGTQPIALAQRIDQERGQATVSLSRPPNTGGVNGTGKLLSVVVRAIGAGSSKVSIVQINARDSEHKQIAVQTEPASLEVKP